MRLPSDSTPPTIELGASMKSSITISCGHLTECYSIVLQANPDLRGFFQPNLFPEYTVFSTVCMYKTVNTGKTVNSGKTVLSRNRIPR